VSVRLARRPGRYAGSRAPAVRSWGWWGWWASPAWRASPRGRSEACPAGLLGTPYL